MLVLTRRINESVVIGEGPNAITVKIVEVSGGKIRLGFDAPKEVPILRSELLDGKRLVPHEIVGEG